MQVLLLFLNDLVESFFLPLRQEDRKILLGPPFFFLSNTPLFFSKDKSNILHDLGCSRFFSFHFFSQG